MSDVFKACANTDKEIWRGPDEGNGSYYADSLHITKGGGLGIDCGGRVYVKPIREWHRLAAAGEQKPDPQPAPGWEQRETDVALAINDELCRQIDAKEERDTFNVTSKIVALPIMQGLIRSSQSTSDAGGGVNCENCGDPIAVSDPMFCGCCREMGAALSNPAAADSIDDDPSADERWQSGLDFAMQQLCTVMGVDPNDVTWDAATETLDGDVRAVVWNILRAKMGEDWKPAAADSNASAEARLREALEQIAADHACGCSPCTGQCRSQEALQITVDAMRDIASEALSPDPHASDCEKQGETKKAFDETFSAETVLMESFFPNENPSDRPADVTVDELRGWLVRKGVVLSSDMLSRALLDAFEVSRK